MPDVLSEEEARTAREQLDALVDGLCQVLLGQRALIDAVVCGLVAGGHLLLEGLPGLGKTQLVKALGRALALDARRIQFTPDLLPGDITGSPILEDSSEGRRFVFHPGPLFGHLVLADEINRASPKTQSALLEAMQERGVTVLGETHPLPQPFFVLATQNPIELEGTYPLPEAQLDRFLFKLDVARPEVDVLARVIAERELGVEAEVPRVLERDQVRRLQETARRVHLPHVTVRYIARLVDATHPGASPAAEAVLYGASPRAALSLAAAAKARALMEGRIHASLDDVQSLAVPVLQHRIGLTHRAKLDGLTPAALVRRIVSELPRQERELPATLTPVRV